jgi:hypothetical protein
VKTGGREIHVYNTTYLWDSKLLLQVVSGSITVLG